MLTELKKFREQIDKIDSEMVNLLKKRLKIVRNLGNYKKKNRLKIQNKNREKEIILKVKNKSKSPKEKNYLTAIFESIIYNSRKIQGN